MQSFSKLSEVPSSLPQETVGGGWANKELFVSREVPVSPSKVILEDLSTVFRQLYLPLEDSFREAIQCQKSVYNWCISPSQPIMVHHISPIYTYLTVYECFTSLKLAYILQHMKIVSNSYEKVKIFKYLGSLLTNQSSIQEEIKCRLKAGNSCYYSVQTLLSYRLLSKNLKIIKNIKQ